MNVKELSREQLLELKENHFYRDIEDDEVDDTKEYDSFEKIPNEVIFEYYGHVDFSNDDFGCSMGLNEDEYDNRGNLQEKFEEVMSLINEIAHDFKRGRVTFDEALEQIKNEVVYLDEE